MNLGCSQRAPSRAKGSQAPGSPATGIPEGTVPRSPPLSSFICGVAGGAGRIQVVLFAHRYLADREVADSWSCPSMNRPSLAQPRAAHSDTERICCRELGLAGRDLPQTQSPLLSEVCTSLLLPTRQQGLTVTPRCGTGAGRRAMRRVCCAGGTGGAGASRAGGLTPCPRRSTPSG